MKYGGNYYWTDWNRTWGFSVPQERGGVAMTTRRLQSTTSFVPEHWSAGSVLHAEEDNAHAMVMSRREYIYYLLYSTFSPPIVSFLFIEEAEESRAEQSRAPHPPALVVRVSVASVDVLTPWRLLFTSSYVYVFMTYIYILYILVFFVERKGFILTIDQFLNFY